MRCLPFLAGCVTLLAAGCASTGPRDVVARMTEPGAGQTGVAPPPGGDPSACWGRETTPAVIETVTEQVILQPAQISADGAVPNPAIYKTVTNQAIVQERREQVFETPCAQQMTPDFIASLQRALAVRGIYRGPINGAMTARTGRAIRVYQRTSGLNSALLSMTAARKLGLVAYEQGSG